MKITGLEIRRIQIDSEPWYHGNPRPKGEPQKWEYPLLRITTDEEVDGFSMGYGANGEGRPNSYTLFDIYADTLIGENPLNVEYLWQTLRKKNRHLYAHTDTALGVLDVALWDIKGKCVGRSIAELLGIYRTQVPTYRTCSYFLTTPEMVYDEALRYKQAGYHGCKFNFFDGPALDIPRLRAAREAVGPEFNLMLDASSYYSFTDALRIGRCLDELGYHWFEEPVYDSQLAILGRLSQELRVPILASETTTLAAKAEYLRLDAVDLLRGDVMNSGGITGLRKAFAACELFGYDLEIHTASSPLLDVANLHVACSVANCEFLETHHDMFRFGLKDAPLTPDPEGYVHLPSGPGLGVEIDWDWIDDHTVGVLGNPA